MATVGFYEGVGLEMAGIMEALEQMEKSSDVSDLIDAAIFALDPILALRLLKNTQYKFTNFPDTSADNITAREVQKIECNLLLGTPTENDIESVMGRSAEKLSDKLLVRVSMIRTMRLLQQEDTVKLQHLIDEDFNARALLEPNHIAGALISFSPRLPANTEKPLSSMLAVFCKLHKIKSKIGNGNTVRLCDELKTIASQELGLLPKDSILPVYMRQISHEISGTMPILSLPSKDPKWALQFPTSHQMLLHSVLWAIRAEGTGNVTGAAAIWDRNLDLVALPITTQRKAAFSRLRCRFAMNLSANDLLQLLSDLCLTSTGSKSAWDPNFEELLMGSLGGLEPTDSLVGIISEFSAAMVSQFGPSNRSAAKFKLTGAEMALEIGSGHLAEDLSNDLLSQIACDPGCIGSEDLGHLMSIVDCLRKIRHIDTFSTRTYVGERTKDVDRTEFDLINFANRLDDAVFIQSALPKISPDPGLMLSCNNFTKHRIIFLRALYAEMHNAANENETYRILKETFFSIPKRYLTGLWKYTLVFCDIAVKHNDATQVLDHMETVVRGTNVSDPQELNLIALDLAAQYERIFNFRQAARMYDRLLTLGVFWIGDGTGIEGSTLYKSAKCWANNFNYDKVLPRVNAALEALTGLSTVADRLALLDLAATTCQHLGHFEAARQHITGMLSLMCVNDLISARVVWKLHYRAGLCAEAINSLEVAFSHYKSATEVLAEYSFSDDDDLILSRDRQAFVLLSSKSEIFLAGTFENNKRTLDSP